MTRSDAEVPEYVVELRSVVERATPALLALGDERSAHRPAPGKWSPREIIGHLIDSASHNHQRFVRAQMQDELVFAGYEQDAWVATQRYQEAPWRELVTLWRAYNVHMAHLMAVVPDDVRARRRRTHNLHELAWRPVPRHEPATLEYFMRDYVAHLRHHLRQIHGLASIAGPSSEAADAAAPA